MSDFTQTFDKGERVRILWNGTRWDAQYINVVEDRGERVTWIGSYTGSPDESCEQVALVARRNAQPTTRPTLGFVAARMAS